MTCLNHWWSTLEQLPGQAAVLAEWQRRLADELTWIRPFLRPTAELAGCYPRPPDDPVLLPYEVVEHGPDDFVGVCPESGETVTLARQDLVVYELDVRRLIQALVDAWQWEPVTPGPTPLSPATWRIGTDVPLAGYCFPVYLCVPLDPGECQQALLHLATTTSSPFLVLLPTRQHLLAAVEQALGQRQGQVVILAEAVGFASVGRCQPSAAGRLRLAWFHQQYLPDEATSTGRPRVFFPTPAQACWADVELHFVDGETLRVRLGDLERRLSFADLGMVDGRTQRPNKQWELLRIFAAEKGVLTWKSPTAQRGHQKQRELLSTRLKTFFRIAQDPIVPTRDRKGWLTVFKVT